MSCRADSRCVQTCAANVYLSASSDADRRDLENPCISLDRPAKAGDRGVDVFVGGPRNAKFQSGCVIAGRHLQDFSPQLAVGDDDAGVVVAVDLREEQVDLTRDAGHAPRFDAVADVERSEHHQHDAGREVAECALERQAYGDAERAEDGNKARRGDAERRQHRDESEHENGVADGVANEECNRSVDTGRFLAEPHNGRVEKSRRHPAGAQDDDRADDA